MQPCPQTFGQIVQYTFFSDFVIIINSKIWFGYVKITVFAITVIFYNQIRLIDFTYFFSIICI